MKNQYTFLILTISWLCFVIGCCISAGYLKAASEFEPTSKVTKTIEAMQIKNQYDMTRADVRKGELTSVKSFMEEYYLALSRGDEKKLKKMISSENAFYDKKEIKRLATYIKSYENLHFDIIETKEKATYFVYASYRICFQEIEGSLPGVTRYFIKKENSGYRIQNDEKQWSKEEQNEGKASLKRKEIKALLKRTEEKYEKAMGQNEQLRRYLEEKQ